MKFRPDLDHTLVNSPHGEQCFKCSSLSLRNCCQNNISVWFVCWTLFRQFWQSTASEISACVWRAVYFSSGKTRCEVIEGDDALCNMLFSHVDWCCKSLHMYTDLCNKGRRVWIMQSMMAASVVAFWYLFMLNNGHTVIGYWDHY